MRRRATIVGLVLVSLVAAAGASDVELGRLFDSAGAANAWSLLGGLASPDLSPEFLARVARLSLESLFIGVLGTALAVIVGFGMAILATRVPQLPDPPRGSAAARLAGGGIRLAVRFLLGFFRSIPDVVWAFLFVRLLGLGPGPAVLAIAVSTGGIVGKLFAELAEAADPGPIHALRRAGAGRLGVLIHGVLPQVQRQWVAYAMFRLECSIRSASILGVVGAGGLGSEIALSVRYFQFDKLATTLFAVLLFVVAIETASGLLRRRRIHWTLAFTVLGSLAALVYLDIPWSEIWRSSMVPQGLAIAASAERVVAVAGRALPLVVETIAIAWCATLAAAAVAYLLAPLASRTLSTGSYLADPPRRRGLDRSLLAILLGGARTIFQICRAIPELTLALVFVLWVGPGPFAGVLAIAVHTVGVLGRLYTDVYEEVERGPVVAIESSGAGRFGVWLYGVVPQVTPRILAFTLYRFEVNVRMTAMVGFVGAGGIGDAIHTAISLFHMTDLTVLLGVMLVVVTCLDWVGDRLRFRILIARFGARDGPRRAQKPSRLSRYRVAPLPAQQGDDDVLDLDPLEQTLESGAARDPDRRRAVVRMLGAGEDRPSRPDPARRR